MIRIAVTGGTGLIGSFLLEILNDDPSVGEIIALARTPGKDLPKVRWVEADFANIKGIQSEIARCDMAFNCLGTTMKKAGSKDAFIKVDKTFVLNFASAAKDAGIGILGTISAAGADSGSGIFYNRVKGEVEEALDQFGFQKLIIMQPSVLLGPRQESRPGESIGKFILGAVKPLMFGFLSKYKPIHAREVALAMWKSAINTESGKKILLYRDMQDLID